VKHDDVAEELLSACSVRLDTDAGPQGINGLPVRLSSESCSWRGHVADARPPHASEPASGSPYPPPDLALITIDDGPEHLCALLGRQLPDTGTPVMARGHTRTFSEVAVTAETESFRLTGTLETTDPDCRLLKLGLGEVTQGMSGAPVLDLGTGDVVGMLRTSRKLDSNLGGWVVPADLIRLLWPEEVGRANDHVHHQDPTWRQSALRLRARRSSEQGARVEGGLSIGKIDGDVVSMISGGTIGSITINYQPENRRPGGPGRQ
jgi:hypothetical protein